MRSSSQPVAALASARGAAAQRSWRAWAIPALSTPRSTRSTIPTKGVAAAAASAARPVSAWTPRLGRGRSADGGGGRYGAAWARAGRSRPDAQHARALDARAAHGRRWRAIRSECPPLVEPRAANTSPAGTDAGRRGRPPGQAAERAAARTIPLPVRDALAHAGNAVGLPLFTNHRASARPWRAAEAGAVRRGEWMRARGGRHVALAARGSRLAVCDLRESLESRGRRLPVEFLAALALVGDRSCLEPIAAASVHARGNQVWCGVSIWRTRSARSLRANGSRPERGDQEDRKGWAKVQLGRSSWRVQQEGRTKQSVTS